PVAPAPVHEAGAFVHRARCQVVVGDEGHAPALGMGCVVGQNEPTAPELGQDVDRAVAPSPTRQTRRYEADDAPFADERLTASVTLGEPAREPRAVARADKLGVNLMHGASEATLPCARDGPD